jgi:potassium efflux system protein
MLFLGFILAVAASGISLDRVTLMLGAFGVGIGFGLQNVVNNFVSGLILLFERPVHIGDVVQVGQLWGEVRRIGIRASVVRTFDGAEVIVPNGQLTSEQVTNWTLSDRTRRLHLRIGVEYGTDPERVLEILRQVAARHSDVLETPPPLPLFLEHGESSLDFELRVWTREFDRGLSVRSELTVAVNRALAEAGIAVPFPQRDLHLRSAAPELRARVRGAESESER